MAHEDRLAVKLRQPLLLLGAANEFLQPNKADGAALGDGRQSCPGGWFDTYQRHALEVCSSIAGGLSAQQRELRSQVLGGHPFSPRTDAPAFHYIAGQKACVRTDARGRNGADLCG